MKSKRPLASILIASMTFAVLTTLLTVSSVKAGQGSTVVTGQNDPAQDIPAIQEALDNAAPGDVIQLAGVFDLAGCQGGLVLDKNITLQGGSDPNANQETATQVRNCGPAFRVAATAAGGGTLTLRDLWFRDQTGLSLMVASSFGPIDVLGNRFTGNRPILDSGNAEFRFALASANVLSATLEGLVTIEDNVIDWTGAQGNDTFAGDDNGFAFAATNFSLVIRNNSITTLGEGIEIEGGFGQDNTYWVEGNTLHTIAPSSPAGQVGGPTGSAGEGAIGGHPAVLKIHSNEGVFTILDNEVLLSGVSTGVCMMATTLHEGVGVNRVEGNKCQMTDQLAGILGGWGGQPPFFVPAPINNTVVADNVFSGTAQFGIALIDRRISSVTTPLVNDGHGNLFYGNNFSKLETARADIAFDQETYENVFIGSVNDSVLNFGNNSIQTNLRFLPTIRHD